jgi:hypothetical protein
VNLLDWLPTAAFAGVLWLSRKLIATRLTNSVRHEFDTKLETLKSDLRTREESLKADLRAKELEITSLRGGALAGLASRLAGLDKRRLEGVEQLWSAVNALGPAKTAAMFMAVMNFEAAAREAAKNPRFRQLFDIIAKPLNFEAVAKNDAWKARPFVSPLAWALFSAYQAIVLFAVTRLKVLQMGIENAPEVLDASAIANLIKAALPHRAAYIDEHGPGVYHYLLDELETKLLDEMRRMLQGSDSDAAGLVQAAAILKVSDPLMETISKGAASSQEAERAADYVQVAEGG